MDTAHRRQLVRDLALALRQAALPWCGSHSARSHAAKPSASGDVTFAIDSQAERALGDFMQQHAPGVAFFSEDQGLVAPSQSPSRGPQELLVVDPIDGTRPAVCGLESCCVSVACAPFSHEVSMGEISVGCVVEIPSGTVFLAERGKGVLEAPAVDLSPNGRLERMFWSYGFRGRPARATCEVLADLIDLSSVGGASFELGSAAYDMTRVLTGQLDAYVEPGPLLVDQIPGMRAEFERVGQGSVLNNSPYDLAGAIVLLEQAGAVVTDACGDALGDRPLLGSGADFQMSCVAAANRELHHAILASLDSGLFKLKALA
jgi:myo-inositol-1(or 4)-monophosphatase